MATHTIEVYDPLQGKNIDILYYKTETECYYSSPSSTTPITSMSVPTFEGYVFDGCWLEGKTVQYVYPTGQFTDAFLSRVWQNDGMILVAWTDPISHKVVVDPNNGSGGTSEFYCRIEDGAFFADSLCEIPIESVDLPTFPRYTCRGLFESTVVGSEQYATSFGVLLPALSAVAKNTDLLIYAGWLANCEITLNPKGGIGGTSVIYYDIVNQRFCIDENTRYAITEVTPPTKNGYTFAGYYTQETGGEQAIDADGLFVAGYAAEDDAILFAHWVEIPIGGKYTLSFDTNGGTGNPSPIEVQVGVEVGDLPTTSMIGFVFVGWYIGIIQIVPDTIWMIEENSTAVAHWERANANSFGRVVDYFYNDNPALVPIESGNGDNKQRICVSHVGRYESGVSQVSGVWRNPFVRYAVVNSCTVEAVLGKAWPNVGRSVSGYMLVRVTVDTAFAQWPVVTFEAVANEGADAINKFNIAVQVSARTKAQNLLGAVSTGGKLHRCTLVASCDPVVVAENMMPCASDVVHGKLTVSAETISPKSENAPTAANGFVSIGEPKQTAEKAYTGYSITAEKEII